MHIFLFLIGISVGSFISAITYRIPRNLEFIKGRSFCDSCKAVLTWYDNIPLFSYLFYHGKSRCCNKKISIRYPLIELATGFAFVLLTPSYTLLFTLSLIIFIIDLEHQIIPDELSWLILFLGFLTLSSHLFSSLFAGFFFASLFLFLNVITKGRGMGLGDVKLAIPLGLWLGFEKGLTWIVITFILGGIIASILLLLKRANLKTKLAFGPFMIVGFWIVLIWK